MTPPLSTKTCKCGYTGDDFGRDSHQLDGLARACKPCQRLKESKRYNLARAWQESADFVLGTTPTDAWRVANGFSKAGARGRPRNEASAEPEVALALAAMFTRSPADETTLAEYEAMAFGGPPPMAPTTPPPPE